MAGEKNENALVQIGRGFVNMGRKVLDAGRGLIGGGSPSGEVRGSGRGRGGKGRGGKGPAQVDEQDPNLPRGWWRDGDVVVAPFWSLRDNVWDLAVEAAVSPEDYDVIAGVLKERGIITVVLRLKKGNSLGEEPGWYRCTQSADVKGVPRIEVPPAGRGGFGRS